MTTLRRLVIVRAGGLAIVAANFSASLSANLPARLSANVSAAPYLQGAGPSDTTVERHHYSMTARVRPLVVFWISRSGVGDAIVTWRHGPREAGYSLLIGSDPDRAPRGINRWGYIDEEIRGADAKLIGLMTQSDEATVEEAEASVRRPASGDRTFRMIQATIDHDEARSVVKSIDAPGNYTFRDVGIVLDLATRRSIEGKSRVVRLPAGTRPGLLSALADLIHVQVEKSRAQDGLQSDAVVPFVYHGRIFELREAHARHVPTVTVGSKTYHRVVAADFEIKSAHDGEVSRFSMVFGAEGRLAEVPIALSYQPRWWMQIDLALDDDAVHASADGE